MSTRNSISNALAGHIPAAFWAGLVAVTALSFVVVGARLVNDALPLAVGEHTGITELARLAGTRLVEARGEDLVSLQQTVQETRSDLAPATRAVRALGLFAPALGWVPALDSGVASWAAHAERFESDLDAVDILLGASTKLIDVQERAEALLTHSSPNGLVSALKSTTGELESSFSSARGHVSRSIEVRNESWPPLRLPTDAGAMSGLPEIEDRVLEASILGRRAAALVGAFLEIGDRLGPLLSKLDSGSPEASESASLSELAARLPEVGVLLDAAIEEAGALAAALDDSEFGGGLTSSRVNTAIGLLRALREINAAAAATLEVLMPLFPEDQAA